jgi:hypothetical protein
MLDASFLIGRKKYGRRNAGSQDSHASHLEQAERRYKAIRILTFYGFLHASLITEGVDVSFY